MYIFFFFLYLRKWQHITLYRNHARYVFSSRKFNETNTMDILNFAVGSIIIVHEHMTGPRGLMVFRSRNVGKRTKLKFLLKFTWKLETTERFFFFRIRCGTINLRAQSDGAVLILTCGSYTFSAILLSRKRRK